MASRAAVVIGINYEPDPYARGQVRVMQPALRFAEADARAMAAELEQAGYKVALLCGAAATDGAIRSALVAQRRIAGAEGHILFYFAGYYDFAPDPYAQVIHLVPVDADFNNLASTGIPLYAIARNYVGTVEQLVVLLDCCLSGRVGTTGRMVRPDDVFSTQIEEEFRTAPGRTALAACANDAATRETTDLKHGVFTYALLEHWRTSDKEVTITSLAEYTTRLMQERGLPPPIRGGRYPIHSALREAGRQIPSAPVGGHAPTNDERQNQVLAAIYSLTEAGWLELLRTLDEDPDLLVGADRITHTHTLVTRWANGGGLDRLELEVQRQVVMEQTIAVGNHLTWLRREFGGALARDSWTKAIRLGERLLSLETNHSAVESLLAATYIKRGKAYNAKGKYSLAIADWTRVIELLPGRSDFYYDRGISYSRNGDYDAAIADNTRALELGGKYGNYYWQRGVNYRQKGDYPQAISDYTCAIECEPQAARYYWSRGVSYGLNGDYDLAIADFTRGIELAPEAASYYRERGGIYGQMGDSDRAIADFTRSIELAPEAARYYYDRSLIYMKKSDYARAIADLTGAIERDPQQAEYYWQRGVSHREQGDYARALPDLTQAIQLAPQRSQIYYSRGLTYKHQSNRVAARADFEQALALGYDKAQTALDEL